MKGTGSVLLVLLAPMLVGAGGERQVDSACRHMKPPAVADLDADLPNVLLLGDSISVGYGPQVKRLLEGEANVAFLRRGHRPANLGNTRGGLKAIRQGCISSVPWSVIHFNFGQNDFAYRNFSAPKGSPGRFDKEHGRVTVPLEEYTANLQAIVAALHETGADLVWASTTFVPDGDPGRVVGDEVRYNAAAAGVMQRSDVHLNDLHAYTASFDPGLFAAPGDVHYTTSGSARLAEKIAEEIRAALARRAQR